MSKRTKGKKQVRRIIQREQAQPKKAQFSRFHCFTCCKTTAHRWVGGGWQCVRC